MPYYVQVTNEHGDGYILDYYTLHTLADDLEMWLDEAEASGDIHSWTIELVQMTQEEYNELPEFEGY
jgi:hypothetical protein